VKALVKQQTVDTECTKKPRDKPVSVEKENADWECEYCTYLNVKSSRVCDVCCKSRSLITSEQCDQVEDMLNESMANMNVSTAVEEKKGKLPKKSITFWLGTKMYS